MAAREGFFTAAYELRRRPDLDRHIAARLEVLLAWFRENLDKPDKFTRSTAKGSGRTDETKSLSWFKPTTTAALARSRDLIALLGDEGFPIETLRSDRIGYVLYEDASQIVAEPFADTPT